MTFPKRILVRGLTWLGDAVMSLPTLAGLRLMFPEAEIRVQTRPELAELYGPLAVDRPEGQDLALILPRSFRSAWEAWRAGIPRRAGFAQFPRTLLLTDSLPRAGVQHRVREYFALLSLLGEPPGLQPPAIDVPDEARAWAAAQLPGDGWVAVNPGATYGAAKQWLPDRYAEVVRRLMKDHKVVIVGKEPVPGVAGTLDLTGRTGIMQLAAVLARAEFLLTNDTGPMHVADAVGTRVVAVFGPTDPVTTSPFRPHTLVRKPIECSPCLERTCPLGHHRCMTQIEPEEVYRACLG